MPTDREQKMEKALPAIRKCFEEALKREPKWRSFFDVFEGAKADPAKGRVRVREERSEPLNVQGLPAGAAASRTTATVVGSLSIETELVIDDADLDALGTDGSAVDLDEWAVRSAQAGPLALAHVAKANFDAAAPSPTTTTVATLDHVIAQAREPLGRLTLDLVVNPETLLRIDASPEKKQAKAALNGGTIVALSSLPEGRGWLLPHRGRQLVVETLDAPTVRWDIADGGGVRLFSHEEFVVVPRRTLPVRHLSIV